MGERAGWIVCDINPDEPHSARQECENPRPAERADEQQLREAKKLRREIAKAIRACTCAYPLVKFRNGSGHADDCPAHALWKENRGYVW